MSSAPLAAARPRLTPSSSASSLLMRSARQLLAPLEWQERAEHAAARESVDRLLRREQILQGRWRLLQLAERRGWLFAAARLWAEVLRETQHGRERAAEAAAAAACTAVPTPPCSPAAGAGGGVVPASGRVEQRRLL